MTETAFKRDKVIPSQTEHVETQCGTLHATFGFQEERLIEVRGLIGKGGTCCNCQLDNLCKIISMYLQSPEPRYKIIKKFYKNLEGSNCGQPFKWKEKDYTSCHDYIAQKVIEELEKQIG